MRDQQCLTALITTSRAISIASSSILHCPNGERLPKRKGEYCMKPSVIVWDLETVPDFDGLTPMMSGLRTRVRAIRAVFFFSFDTRDDFKTLKSNRAPLPTSVGLP